MLIVCAPTPSEVVQENVPSVVSVPSNCTADGPQSTVEPSLKVTFALRMSPGAVSPGS
jgi:hypothetical protein